jgi:hypothetical protein
MSKQLSAGTVVAVLLLIVLIAFIVGAFAGIEPMATYAETVKGWFSSISIISNSPSGTYIATVFGIEQSITFKGSTVEFFNMLDGKRVFDFSISQDGSSITLRNVATGDTSTLNYRYIKEHEIVAIGATEYYRQ